MSLLNNSWQDECWVSIQKEDGSDGAYCSKTRDITIGGGDSGIDVLNVNCGQILKINRQEPFEISFDNVIPIFATDFRHQTVCLSIALACIAYSKQNYYL